MYVRCLFLACAMSFGLQSGHDPGEHAGNQLQTQLQTSPAYEEARTEALQHRQQAIQLNELAAHIRSEAEAQTIVDSVAKMFERDLPPVWATSYVRQRVARAEYEAVSDASRLIPEQRIADVWNEYVRQIGAPDEALVTPAEIHSMRDEQYAAAQLMWTRDLNRTIWTMPNVVAIGPDGKVADGCRALDALHVIFDMDNLFDNVRGARERVKKGIVASDEIKKRLENSPPRERVLTTLAIASTNPLRPAEQRYVSEHGLDEFNRLLERLFDKLFPE